MNIRKSLGLSVLLGAAWASAAHAQDAGGIQPSPENPPTRQGTRGANFLHLLLGARSNAMAGAVGSSTAGPIAWFDNAAGAAVSEGFSVAAGHNMVYGDFGLSQNYAALNVPLLGGVVGINFQGLNSGKLDRTSEGSPLGDVQTGRTFEWTSTAIGGGYARRLTDRLSVGAQIKFVSEGIPDANTSWVMFDAGTQFTTGIYGLSLGGSLQNIGGSAKADGALLQNIVNTPDFSRQSLRGTAYSRNTDPPTVFRFTAGENLVGNAESLLGSGGGKHSLTAEAAVNTGVDISSQLAVGAEYSFRNVVFARGGKRFFNDKRSTGTSSGTYGLSGGFGIRLPVASRSLRFDYSYTGVGDLQNIQAFSFEIGR